MIIAVFSDSYLFTFRNQVLGRKVQDVRICACPGRDRTTKEAKEAAESKKRPTNDVVPANTDSQAVQPLGTSTPNSTPPPTPQVSSVPQSPHEGASTSAGADETSSIKVPKLTKKRCE